MGCGYSRSRMVLRSLGQHAIDAGATDPKPTSDFRWPDAISLEPDDFVRLSASGRHAALVAMQRLRTGDPFALALKHRLSFGLTHSADHREHQTPCGCGGVERLIAGDRQDAEPDLLRLQSGDDIEQIGNRTCETVDP